jgi:hypothetical protein
VEILTMRRHLTFALALAAVGACTFPNATYSDGGAGDDSAPYDSGGTDRSASSSSGSSGGSSGSSGGGDAAKDHGGMPDSASDVTSSDSTSSSSGSSSGGGPCDMDSDGFQAAGAPCGGNDCCDTDANANPAQTMFFDMPDKCGSFDYNCDTKLTPKYSANLTCSGVPAIMCFYDCPSSPCTCGGTQCNYGYLSTDPGCGNSAAYGTCTSNMLGTACVAPSTAPNQIQACN